jgi:hypothetical protein
MQMRDQNRNPSAGLGDPYWYEWSVGQLYIVDLLDPDAGIESVVLQKTGGKGLDDVVVSFHDGSSRFIQVKHTRAGDTLTFGDLIATDTEGSPTLLRQIAEAWDREQQHARGACEAWLLTNRKPGQGGTSRASGVVRPSLEELVAHLQTIENGAGLEAPATWAEAWRQEWLPQLDCLEDDGRKLLFLRALRIKTSEDSLSEVRNRLVARLQGLLHVSEDVARGLLARLDTALPTWATSVRGDREAVHRETVYEQLCLQEDRFVGEHFLVPPMPFFPTRLPVVEEIATLLRTRAAPIVFVSGEPGSGKTAIVSALANARDAVVDARFYAYRPITPDQQLLPADADRTTKARALWSDLLLQLRLVCRGRLAELRVPMHAGSLTTDELRGHVLRLANDLGRLEGKPFVLAVDGIDHAARAGVATDSMISSLVPPDQVPEHVVFLIGGQPPEAYQAYPQWLRAPTAAVRRFDLPRLTQQDTRTLAASRLELLDPAALGNAVRDIWGHCNGHTLSTVFAVEEAALLQPDLSRLPAVLAERGLASGIEHYYGTIWAAATRTLLPATAAQLAACVSLSPSRTTADAFFAVTEGALGSLAACNAVLQLLRPLVVLEHGGFRVFHNDVRVFLLRILVAEPQVYRDSAARLADHLCAGTDARALHAAAQKLYGIAGKSKEQASIFKPHYVLEGHAIGVPVEELTDQGLAAADALLHVGHDWPLVHHVVTGLLTLEQLRKCLEWRSAGPTIDASATSTTRSIERRVPLAIEWTRQIVSAALQDVTDLCERGELLRARSAFARWFHGLSPQDVESRVRRAGGAEDAATVDGPVLALARQLGRASALTSVLLPISTGDETGEVECGYARGLLEEAWKTKHDKKFVAALHRVKRFFVTDVQGLLSRLVDRRAWRRCFFLLRLLGPTKRDSWSFRLHAGGVAALLGNKQLRKRYVVPVLTNRSAALRGAAAYVDSASDSGAPDQLTVMAWTAFLLATEEPDREAAALREEVQAARSTTRHDEREEEGVSQILHAAAILGSMVRTARDNRAAAVHVDADLVRGTAHVLMTAPASRRHQRPFGYAPLAALLLRGLAECVVDRPALRPALRGEFLAWVADRDAPIGALEAFWPFLFRTGNRPELLSFADRWIGQGGKAWAESPAKRYELVERVIALLNEIGEHSRVAFARELLAWAEVGYIDHKEYALSRPLEWFEALGEVFPSAWQSDGLHLFAVSGEATRTGSNRLASEVDTAVLGNACLQGPAAVASVILSNESPVEPGDRDLIRGLLRVPQTQPVERDFLLAVWAFCTGQLLWQNREDRKLLGAVRETLIAAALRCSIPGIPSAMEEMAPAEFASQTDDKEDEVSSPDEGHEQDPGTRLLQACASKSWKSVGCALRDIIQAADADAADAVRTALQALLDRRNSVWWFDDAESAYATIFPLLNPEERWSLVAQTIRTREYDEPALCTQTLSENLEDLCRLWSIEQGPDALREGVRRLLAMHDTWISAGGRLPNVTLPALAESRTDTRWQPLFAELLLRHLAFDEMSYVEATLRGIFRLISLSSSPFEYILPLVDQVDVQIKRRFLLIAEALVLSSGSKPLRQWLARAIDDPRLDIGISVWSALRLSELALGTEPYAWPTPDREPPRIVVSGRPGLISRPRRSAGLRPTAPRPSATILQFLLEAGVPDVEQIEGQLAQSLRDDPPSPKQQNLRRRGSGLVANVEDEAEADRLFRILRVVEREGRFNGVAFARICQVLVPAADPFVFLSTARSHRDAAQWPVDQDLDALNDSMMVHQLVSMLISDLPESLHLLAGTIESYSSKWDVRVAVHLAVEHHTDHESNEPPHVLNGRSSIAFQPPNVLIASAEPAGCTWVTRNVGGLFVFPGGTLDIFPGRIWQQELGWRPSPSPLVWMRDDERVAYFERRLGPVRDINPGDFPSRQPLLGRWVCTSAGWDQIVQLIGTPVRRIFPERAPVRLR